MPSRKKLKIFIYSCLIIILIGGLGWWLIFNAARQRDFQRIGDMKVVQAGLISYFSQHNTYQISGCSSGMIISQCQEKSSLINFKNLIDPVNRDDYRYVVYNLTQNDFSIAFTLETGVGGLGAGQYFATKNGIKR